MAGERQVEPAASPSLKLRYDLEHRPAAGEARSFTGPGAAVDRRAVEIACGTHDHAGVGIGPVLAIVSEDMHQLFRPAAAGLRREFEDGPAARIVIAARIAAGGRRAIKIAGGIEDNAGIRPRPVLVLDESMEHPLFPGSVHQLEHRTGCLSPGSAFVSRAEEITGFVENQAGVRIEPVA